MTEQQAEALLTAEPPLDGPPSPAGDPDAPYGRLGNGRPRKNPQKIPNVVGGAPKRTAQKPRTSKPSYAERVSDTLKMPAALLALVGNARGSEALVADGATLTLYGPQLGAALGGLAEKKPEIAAALDKILGAGPYGEIAALVMVMGLQLAANHKVMAPVAQMGVMTPEEIMAAVAAS